MCRPLAFALVIAAALLSASKADGYSVLAHRAVIDAAWERSLRPALQSRFPLSAEELLKARAHAYGGCLIQDLGYAPFSSRFFGNLTHYVRSGDFLEALLHESRTANELAFALGALAHFAADTRGHALAVNRAVPLVYPELRRKYGDEITYEEHPAAHLKTEFGFDVLQVARQRYAPDEYHDFIGFEISKELLSRAFRSTYGLDIEEVFADLDVSITTFRWSLTTVIPAVTKVAWQDRRKDIEAQRPGTRRDEFVFASTRADFEKRFGKRYSRPNLWHRFVGWLLKLVPRIGPFKPLAFRTPTPEAERLFVESFDAAVDRYRDLISAVRPGGNGVENRNLDTGERVAAGTYRLVDDTYAEWLTRLSKRGSAAVPPAVRAEILNFYRDAARPRHVSAKDWRKTLERVEQLRTAPQQQKSSISSR